MFQYNGKHLLIDANCTQTRALTDLAIGQTCLETLVRTINMKMVLPPIGVQFPNALGHLEQVAESLENEGLGQSRTATGIRKHLDDGQQQSGYSTFVMIAESHLSLHTFPEAGFLTFDCYSCRDFQHEDAIKVLDQFFNFGEQVNIQIIPRPFAASKVLTNAIRNS
ncbi:MAG: S-adenosylmethionine decarboxylase [Myxococcota bacterium]|nr:S-adenosylmethionine decarboxylase [Myxococcota bacterium]